MGLSCLSCKEDVSPDDAKVFSQVFLCPSCFTIAEQLYRRGEAELKMMLLVLKEAIRVAALKGELQFHFGSLEDLPKEDLLAHLAKLAAETQQKAVPRTECQTSSPKTPSEVPMLPSAPTAGGKEPIS